MGMLSLSSCVLIMMVTKFEQEVQMKHVPFYIPIKKDQIDRRAYDTCEIQTKINTMSTLMFTFICYALVQPKRFRTYKSLLSGMLAM